MSKIVRNVCDTARDRSELNKGGVPVKNASYWKRQADQLRAEVEALKQERWSVVATRNEALNKVAELRAEVKRLESELAGMKIAYRLVTDVREVEQ